MEIENNRTKIKPATNIKYPRGERWISLQVDHFIEKVLDGDRAAFADLYNQTIHTVYRTLYFLSYDKSELDDVVQNIYIELFKNLAKFDSSRSSFYAWLNGITVRQHQAHRRKKWREGRNKAIQARMEVGGIEPDFSTLLIDKVSNEHVIKSIETLSYKTKQVIILHYLNDLTHEEISEILKIPLGTVKSRLHSALNQLRKKLGSQTEISAYRNNRD